MRRVCTSLTPLFVHVCVCVLSGAFTLDPSFFIRFIALGRVLIFKNRGLKSILQALSTGVRLLDQELL